MRGRRLDRADGYRGSRLAASLRQALEEEPAVERDLDIVLRLAAALEERTRWERSLGVVALAQGFATAIREELDFRVEARNTAAVAAAWSADRCAGNGAVPVVVPAIREQYCTRQVLVTEWLDGVSPRGCRPGGSGTRPGAGRRRPVDDPLPAAGDPAALRDALLDLVTRPDDIDEQRLERAPGQFMALHLAGSAAPGTEMFTDLFRLVSRFKLGIPPEIAAVFRALATLVGTLARLSPGFDIVTEAREFVSVHMAEQLWCTRVC